jgi:hypothetical protein
VPGFPDGGEKTMKKTAVLITSILLLGFTLFLARCSSSDSGGGFANVDVQYQVVGNTITHNANTAVDHHDPITGTDTRVLTWYCGNYQGNQKQKVVLTFKNTNNTWVLDKTEINGGSCG